MTGDYDPEDLLDRLEERLEEDLEPTTPERAVELWFAQLDDPADSTISTYEYRIAPLLEFLEERGIEDLNDLTPRDLKEFEAIRRDAVDSKSTVNSQLGTIKQFLTYCYELRAVTEDAATALDVPSLSKDDRINTEKLFAQRAEKILDNLDRYRYASVEHVIILILWRTAARMGAVRSLDLRDLYIEGEDYQRLRKTLREDGISSAVVDEILDEVELPILWFRHRPETDTPLKNAYDGERVVNLREETAVVLQRYIEVNRPDLSDEYGREALLATRSGSGRRSKSNIRNWCYILTQPCEFGAECPHDRDPEECEAREHGYGSKCPSSRSPHKLRTGSITDHRDRGWSVADLAEKANAGERLIASVYDQPNALLRASRRRAKTSDDSQDNDTSNMEEKDE